MARTASVCNELTSILYYLGRKPSRFSRENSCNAGTSPIVAKARTGYLAFPMDLILMQNQRTQEPNCTYNAVEEKIFSTVDPSVASCGNSEKVPSQHFKISHPTWSVFILSRALCLCWSLWILFTTINAVLSTRRGLCLPAEAAASDWRIWTTAVSLNSLSEIDSSL